MCALAASLLFALPLQFETAAAQDEALASGRATRSYLAAVRLELSHLRAALEIFGGAGDPLSQDPLREEHFLAPELSLLVSPRFTVCAQLAKALRAGSGDTALVAAAWAF